MPGLSKASLFGRWKLINIVISLWLYLLHPFVDITGCVIKESYQSSTNGPYNASLGCDGDMGAFSLTNAGENESWSVILNESYRITWLFLRIRTGIYLNNLNTCFIITLKT